MGSTAGVVESETDVFNSLVGESKQVSKRGRLGREEERKRGKEEMRSCIAGNALLYTQGCQLVEGPYRG